MITMSGLVCPGGISTQFGHAQIAAICVTVGIS
jgi:hypothetical protein